ncbi:uncharacterized protein LOC112143606 isoform X2 [Oryzias melastigma]|uniref:uncharacterized protein LOC112143606 isoform X2 n=1 Tax=Oryzias melastigma TaxID=30732 RepID=UPI00168D7308|nr:uncharacterized protein LOC112143606 isoform X2 [Oryzias melastigma]
MCSFVLLGFIFTISPTWGTGPDGADKLIIFAAGEESTKIPCGLPSIRTCSSINWSMRSSLGTEVVKAGKVLIPKDGKYRILQDCSLEIAHVLLEDAQLYMCSDGVVNTSISLRFLERFRDCGSNSGVRIRWTNQDNSPLQGDRFTLESSSPCLSKLVITKKQTDHHRTWKCQVDQNDQLKVVSYTSTITDGLEEVFAAVGESVSLPCSSNFSFTSPSDIKWTINDTPLTNSSLQKTFQINKDSLVINKVNSLHAGDYQCSESSGSQRVLNRVRLHTLDVTEEFDPEGENLNLTCILTCAEKCEADFNLTWSERNQNGLQSSLTAAGNTLTKRLLLPFRPPSSQEILCSVQREGALMTSKKWPSVHPLQTLAWLGLPLGLVVCTAVAVYMYMKRKQKTDAAEDLPTVEMVRGAFTIDSCQYSPSALTMMYSLHRVMFMKSFRMRNHRGLSKVNHPTQLMTYYSL